LAAGLYASQERFLGDDMSGPFVTVDLPALGTNFAIPIFVFQGENDHVTPAQLARAYIDTIAAPEKLFVAINGAGHLAMVLKRDEFLKLLVKRVRPLATSAASAGVTTDRRKIRVAVDSNDTHASFGEPEDSVT
jgi:pimeloyl-ACP methyl ester carboxylesterase